MVDDMEEVTKDCVKKIRDEDDARKRLRELKSEGSGIVNAQ